MNSLFARVAAVLAGLSAGALVYADEKQSSPPPDKSGFTLFNPTPRDLMREMATDRPDITESPVTVDAGHVQVELSFFNYAFDSGDGRGGANSSSFAVMPTNVKFGLLNNADIQFVFTPYVREEGENDAGGTDVATGFSDDTQIRFKVNLWGNDGPHPVFGNTAFGVMPFVKFPTGSDDLSNDHVEGGVVLPFSADLPAGFGLGVMAVPTLAYNDESGDYGFELLHTVSIGRQIVGPLAFYVEYVGVTSVELGDAYQALLSGGFTYAISDDWILDWGMTKGISDSADDYSFFAGTSFRF